MSQATVKIRRSASIAMDGLSDADRKNLMAAIERLQVIAPVEWPKELAVRLDESEPVYLLRFSPHLWAFIDLTDAGEFEILDLVSPETLRLFWSKDRKGSVQG
jgi:hypothetical protein